MQNYFALVFKSHCLIYQLTGKISKNNVYHSSANSTHLPDCLEIICLCSRLSAVGDRQRLTAFAFRVMRSIPAPIKIQIRTP